MLNLIAALNPEGVVHTICKAIEDAVAVLARAAEARVFVRSSNPRWLHGQHLRESEVCETSRKKP